MSNVKTAGSAQISTEIGRHKETKGYIDSITNSFRASKNLGVKLDPRAVFNTYIAAVAKCCVALIKMGVLRNEQVNPQDVNQIALDLAKDILK